MNPAKMDRRITLQRRTVVNTAGSVAETYADIATVWCEKKDIRGMERWISQQVKAEINTRFIIRYRSDISPIDRVVFESNNYDVISVLEIGRRKALEITASARAE